jgi:RimJ/RimL family protein N-acetyltransferase
VNKNNDKMLWITDLWNIDYIDKVARLWISIWDYDEHNKWYWADAINAILLFGFYTLNLRNIDLHVFAFNQWAIKCYQKVWFKEYWRRKETYYCNWKFRDEIYMDITKEKREKKNKEKLIS